MKKLIFLFATFMVISFSSFAQQADSIDIVMQKLTENMKEFGSVLKQLKQFPNDSLKVSATTGSSLSSEDLMIIQNDILIVSNRTYGVTSVDLGHGDYLKKYDGYFAGTTYNTNTEGFTSPIVFSQLSYGNTAVIKGGGLWGSESHEFYGRNWWLTKSFKAQTSVYAEKFFTNQYQLGISGDYEWKFAHNLISLGGKFDGGVYSPGDSSLTKPMKPFVYAGAYASLFCAYGSIGMVYSDYIKYKSLYVQMKDLIPIFELGIKTPDIKVWGEFLIALKASYVNYGFYNPKVYMYDDGGQIVEDISKRVDVDFYQGMLSFRDHYGSSVGVGVSTWDLANYYVSVSASVNLRSIGIYF